MNPTLDDLRYRLGEWFERTARPLPWRDTHDPYRIWLSEIILQQTQVIQGMDYYHRFVEQYPTVYDLARATEDEILRLWQGLGYYSRGRNLLRAARMIVDEYDGVIPRDPRLVSKLPGVGPYTQAAILSFAYDLPHAAVDGNVYRVLSRLDACREPIDTPQGQRHYRARAQELLDLAHPGRHNQAMIELGALVCTPRRPLCDQCPIASYCIARLEGSMLQFPIKQGRTEVKERYMDYFWVALPGDEILIRRRGPGDIWQGLYELPLIESERALTVQELLTTPEYLALCSTLETPTITALPVASCDHRLTHRLLRSRLFVLTASDYLAGGYAPHGTELEQPPPQGYTRVSSANRRDYAMPQLLEKLIAQSGLDAPKA